MRDLVEGLQVMGPALVFPLVARPLHRAEFQPLAALEPP